MIQALNWAALGTGFTFFMTATGSAMVFFLTDQYHARFQRAILGFAAGVMTAASIWSLLLPAIEQTEMEHIFPGWFPAAAGVLSGTVFLAALDSLIPYLSERKKKENENLFKDKNNSVQRRNALLMTAITLHNIPEGMAVGLACALAAKEGTGVAGAAAFAIGIGIQNFPEGAAVSLPLREEGRTRFQAFIGGALSGAVEPLFGILVVGAATWASALMPWLLSAAAGAMLYVVVEELIPQAHSRAGTCGFLLGFLIMMVLDVALS